MCPHTGPLNHFRTPDGQKNYKLIIEMSNMK